MLAELVVVCVLDLVEVVFVELAHEAREVGVLEHAREDGFGELVHVFDDEAVAEGAPADHGLERGVFEHSATKKRCKCAGICGPIGGYGLV